jgi:3-methyladenine DNA glycosylase Tag
LTRGAFLESKKSSAALIIYLVVGETDVVFRQSMKNQRRRNQAAQMSKDGCGGFRFVGPTICYAHMQATGMVNDHVVDCFRYQELLNR